MAVSTLNRAQAFGGGCDLWVIPDKDNFSFFSKLDWYLNFQPTRASLHKAQALSPQLKSITNENELPDFSTKIENKSALMLSAELGVPAKIVIEIPVSDNDAEWVKQVHQNWLKLDRLALRVFLPKNLSIEVFNKYWPGQKTDDISVVPA